MCGQSRKLLVLLQIIREFVQLPSAVKCLVFIFLPLSSIADQSRYWGLEDAIINEIIELEPKSDILTQSWVLEPVEPVN